MSVISLKREDAKAAVEYGELAVKASPGDFATHVVLGRALLATEEPARAAAEFAGSRKAGPQQSRRPFQSRNGYSRLGEMRTQRASGTNSNG